MSIPTSCGPFDQEKESIQEFFRRFQRQMSSELHKVRNDDMKRGDILLKFLPVSIISELQRRLAPILLGDATYEQIEEHLLQQFSTSTSGVGASVQFLTYKQRQGQSLEEYARQLNSLASDCKYPADVKMVDRLLRDIFVAGLISSSILSTIIQECDKLSFKETVERAKLLETYRRDVDKINSSRHKAYAIPDQGGSDDLYNIQYKNNRSPEKTYLCYRCGAKGQHFSNYCFAINRTCHLCKKLGHIARICQQHQKRTSSQRPTYTGSHQHTSCKYVHEQSRPTSPAFKSGCQRSSCRHADVSQRSQTFHGHQEDSIGREKDVHLRREGTPEPRPQDVRTSKNREQVVYNNMYENSFLM